MYTHDTCPAPDTRLGLGRSPSTSANPQNAMRVSCRRSHRRGANSNNRCPVNRARTEKRFNISNRLNLSSARASKRPVGSSPVRIDGAPICRTGDSATWRLSACPNWSHQLPAIVRLPPPPPPRIVRSSSCIARQPRLRSFVLDGLDFASRSSLNARKSCTRADNSVC